MARLWLVAAAVLLGSQAIGRVAGARIARVFSRQLHSDEFDAGAPSESFPFPDSDDGWASPPVMYRPQPPSYAPATPPAYAPIYSPPAYPTPPLCGAYGSQGYGGVACPPPPLPYGGYGTSSPPPSYGSEHPSSLPSPDIEPSPSPSPSPSEVDPPATSDPTPYPTEQPATDAPAETPVPTEQPATDAPTETPVPTATPTAAPTGDPTLVPTVDAPTPPPEGFSSRWATVYDYLSEVVVPQMWGVFVAYMPPEMKDMIRNPTAEFTLFTPLYEFLLQDPAILRIFADPTNPDSGLALQRIMAYHFVPGRTLQPNDFVDGLTVTNLLGTTLTVTQRFTDDGSKFYINEVEIARWQGAGMGYTYWINGVMHEAALPSPPPVAAQGNERRYGTLIDALASVPELSIVTAAYHNLLADASIGVIIDGILQTPFTLFAPNDEAIGAYMATLGLQPQGFADLPASNIAAIVAPHLIVGLSGGNAYYPLAALTDGIAISTGMAAFNMPGATFTVSRPDPAALPNLVYQSGAGVVSVVLGDLFVRASDSPDHAVVHVISSLIQGSSASAGR